MTARRRWDDEFRAPSWAAWNEVLALITPETREAWFVVGRGGGKSRTAARIAVERAQREYPRAPGEVIFVGIFAPDRKQAAITLGYVRGLFRHPTLAKLVESETSDSIVLTNGVTVEVVTASTSAPRGRSYACAVVEEAAFLPVDEDAADPDSEIIRAIDPGLARVPGSLLVVISSPFARRGELYAAEQRWGATGGDAHAVYRRLPTAAMNPTFSSAAIARAYAKDHASARAEFGGEFRSDLEEYVSREVLDAVTLAGRAEVPPQEGVDYVAFVDMASGSGGDSAALAVAHHEDGKRVVDLVREARPPFSPSEVVDGFSATLRAYGVDRVTGDRWAKGLCSERFGQQGVHYAESPKDASTLYREAIALLNDRAVLLPDLPRMRSQFLSLQRQTGTGRERIVHPSGGHDDMANVVAGVLCDPSPEAAGLVTWELEVGGTTRPLSGYNPADGSTWKDGRQVRGWKVIWGDEGVVRRPNPNYPPDVGLWIENGENWRGVDLETGSYYKDGKVVTFEEFFKETR